LLLLLYKDWMLLEWNDRIHVFHGTYDNATAPRTTANASFFNLRAPGALLVSAVRTNGVTEFVSVTAEVDTLPGEPAVVVTDLVEPVRWVPSTAAVNKISDGTYSIALKSSEYVHFDLVLAFVRRVVYDDAVGGGCCCGVGVVAYCVWWSVAVAVIALVVVVVVGGWWQ
jgi:hypothetical protein